jgi:hypothetical protein
MTFVRCFNGYDIFIFMLVTYAAVPSLDMMEKIVEASRNKMYGDESAQKTFRENRDKFVAFLTGFMGKHQSLTPANFQEIVQIYAELRQASATRCKEFFGVMRATERAQIHVSGWVAAVGCYAAMGHSFQELFVAATQSAPKFPGYGTATFQDMIRQPMSRTAIMEQACQMTIIYGKDDLSNNGEFSRRISDEKSEKNATLALYNGLLNLAKFEDGISQETYDNLARAFLSVSGFRNKPEGEKFTLEERRKMAEFVDLFITKKYAQTIFHTITFSSGHQVLTYSCEKEDQSIIHGDSAPYLVIPPPVEVWNTQLKVYLQHFSTTFLAKDAPDFIENMAQMLYRAACLLPFYRGGAAFSEWVLAAGLQSFNQRQQTIALSVSTPPSSIAYFDQLALSAFSFEDFLEKFKRHFHVQQATAPTDG